MYIGFTDVLMLYEGGLLVGEYRLLLCGFLYGNHTCRTYICKLGFDTYSKLRCSASVFGDFRRCLQLPPLTLLRESLIVVMMGCKLMVHSAIQVPPFSDRLSFFNHLAGALFHPGL